jgi:hypothetical protein
MDLREVASVSGRSGLFKIVKPTKTGVILETIDAQAKKFVAGSNERVSILNEIAIYTTDAEGSVPLEKVLQTIHSTFGNNLPVDSKASNDALFDFLGKILPNFDASRVYVSDIKKLVSWYTILAAKYPEILTGKVEKTSTVTSEETNDEVKPKKAAAKKTAKEDNSEEKPKKAAAKKTAKAKKDE